MVALATTLELAGYAVGALGGVLIFFEFFQQPSYVEYDPEINTHTIDISPTDGVTEHTWSGRIGAFLIAVAFALEFFAALIG